MFTCSCCDTPKSYSELRNLYRHQRKYDPSFIEPKDRAKLAYDASPRHCLACDAMLSYQTVVASGNNAKYCSRKCSRSHSGAGRKRNIDSYQCLQCEQPTRPNCTFCSISCGATYKREKKITEWLDGSADGSNVNGSLKRFIREYVIDQAGRKCVECGWNKENPVTQKSPLHVDHIDGNSNNNRPENLRVLCPNCHSLTPTFGSLNMGNGREQRRIARRAAIAAGRPVG